MAGHVRLSHLDAHAVEALGLSDELHDLLVEVHVQLAVVRVTDDQRRLIDAGTAPRRAG